MKKFFLISILVLFSSLCFAGEKYKGDVQLHGGFDFDKINIEQERRGITINAFMKHNAYDMGLESWHLFAINDALDLGFSIGCDFSFAFTGIINENGMTGDIESLVSSSYYIGPALQYNVLSFLSLRTSVGFNEVIIQERAMYDYSSWENRDCPGFYGEVQAKFIPNKLFSPVLGYRFSLRFDDKMTDDNGNSKDVKVKDFSNLLYIGASVNW